MIITAASSCLYFGVGFLAWLLGFAPIAKASFAAWLMSIAWKTNWFVSLVSSLQSAAANFVNAMPFL